MGTEFDSSEEDEIRQYSSDQAADGFESVSTGEIGLTDHLIYVYSTTGDMLQTIDPSETNDPLGDAAAVENCAHIQLPPGVITQGGNQFNPVSSVTVKGYGPSRTTVEWTSDIKGVVSGTQDEWAFEDLRLKGPGTGTSTNPAMETTGAAALWELNRVRFQGWEQAYVDSGAAFNWKWGTVYVNDCDGGGAAVISLGSGAPVRIDNLYLNPSATASAQNSQGIWVNDRRVDIGALNIDGSTGRALSNSDGDVTVDTLAYEPSNQQSTPDSAVWIQGRNTDIRQLFLKSGTVDYAIQPDFTPQNVTVGHIRNAGATINNTIVNVNDAPQAGKRYKFVGIGTADVTDNSGDTPSIVNDHNEVYVTP